MSGEPKQPAPAPNPNNEGDSKGGLPIVVKPKTSSKHRYSGLVHGNPKRNGGRPKGLAQLARAATKDGDDLVKFFVSTLKTAKKHSDRIKAAEWLADRGFGKAVDMSMDITGGDEKRELARSIARELAQNPPIESPHPQIKVDYIQS